MNELLNLLEKTVESTSDGIYVSGSEDKHILSNSRFLEMFKIPKALLTSSNSQEILDIIADQLEDSLSFLNWGNKFQKKSTTDIFTIKFLDGRTIECYTTPLVKDSIDEGRLWTFEDTTKLKKTEDTAKLYLDLMSHDIRNRLQGIVMSVEILSLMIEDPNSALIIIDIENNVRRCATLISKVKAAEKIDDAPVVSRSISDALSASLKIINTRFSDVDVDCDFEEQQVIMNADRFLETLFINILENAVQHNPRDDKQVWIQLRKKNSGYEISISDNGPGINSQRKIELFDKSRRYGGVGLHVVMQIARKYGGNLGIYDRVIGDHTKGANFRLWIPEPIVRWG